MKSWIDLIPSRRFALSLCAFGMLFLAGCFEKQVHLTLQDDGSGTLEVKQSFARPVIFLIEESSGTVAGILAENLRNKGLPLPDMRTVSAFVREYRSVSEETLKQKAAAAGLSVKVVDFFRNVTADAEHLSYMIEFDDAEKLFRSGLLEIRLQYIRDRQGQTGVMYAADPEREAQLISGIERYRASGLTVDELLPAVRLLAGKARPLLLSLRITLPGEISRTGGLLHQTDSNTAAAELRIGLNTRPESILQLLRSDLAGTGVFCRLRTGASSSVNAVIYTKE